nr:cytochrome P450 [Agasicles hygrophila]
MWGILLLTAIAAVIYYFYDKVIYWKKKNVPQEDIINAVKTIVTFIMGKSVFADFVVDGYKLFPNARYTGIYQSTRPLLMIKDLDLIKDIAVKNFDHFTDHSNFLSDVSEPLWARNLFALKGQKWRDMRPILSPSFTSSKMKMIFHLISECAENFSNFFSNKEEEVIEVEFKDVFTRFTNDVIATTAFGVKTDSLKDRENDFYVMGNKLTKFTSVWLGIKLFIIVLAPKIADLFKLSFFDKEVTAFFTKTINSTIETRKEKGIVRPDMIHLLMQAQKEQEEHSINDKSFAAQEESELGKGGGQHVQLSNLDIAAQAFIFFFGGFDSVSTAMSFMAYELAINPAEQSRLREEILETLQNCNGHLTYEALLKMEYMDMVVSESLRKWPAQMATDRQCTKPYVIQPESPDEKPLQIEENSIVWIPIYAIHNDPKYYENPEKFDPERFSEENKGNIAPYTYLPFGLGPRNCIGSRFALLELKTVFFYLLLKFEIVPTKKSQIPIKYAPGFSVASDKGFWFALKKLK